MKVSYNPVQQNQNISLKNNKAQKPAFGFVRVEIPHEVHGTPNLRDVFSLFNDMNSMGIRIKKILGYPHDMRPKDKMIRLIEGFSKEDDKFIASSLKEVGLQPQILPGEIPESFIKNIKVR